MAFLAKDILEIYKILINNKKNDIDIKDLFNMVSNEIENSTKNMSVNFDNNLIMEDTLEFDEDVRSYDDIDLSLIKRFLN